MRSNKDNKRVEIRPAWGNCASEIDHEIVAIDRFEDALAPVTDDIAHIRFLISNLELCHHKAERWVENIIEGIGAGRSDKGKKIRGSGELTDTETQWKNCFSILSAWSFNLPADAMGLSVFGVADRELVGLLGERTPLKVWQVARVLDKIKSFIEPDYQYVEMTVYSENYRERFGFVDLTLKAKILDSVDGEAATISLAGAIDTLELCNWNFINNLKIVLAAIGGDRASAEPFCACSRNIRLVPILGRMKLISDTLRAFCGEYEGTEGTDEEILTILGELTPVKRWLAASLEKTIRLQLGLTT